MERVVRRPHLDAERRVRAGGHRLRADLAATADLAERPVRVERPLLPRPVRPGPPAVRPRARVHRVVPEDLPLAVVFRGVHLARAVAAQVRDGDDPDGGFPVAVGEDQRVVVRVERIRDGPLVPVVPARHPPPVVVAPGEHRELIRLLVVLEETLGVRRGTRDGGDSPGRHDEEGRRDRRDMRVVLPEVVPVRLAVALGVAPPVRVERRADVLPHRVGVVGRVDAEPDVRRAPALAEPVRPRVVEERQIEPEGGPGGVVVLRHPGRIARAPVLRRHGDQDALRQHDEPLRLVAGDVRAGRRVGVRVGPGRIAGRVDQGRLDHHVHAVDADDQVGRVDRGDIQGHVRAVHRDDDGPRNAADTLRLQGDVGAVDAGDGAGLGVRRLQDHVGPVDVGVGLARIPREVRRLQDDVRAVDADDQAVRRRVRHLQFGPGEPDGRARRRRDREPQAEVRVVGDRPGLAGRQRVRRPGDGRYTDRPGIRRDQGGALVERHRVGDRVVAAAQRRGERHPPTEDVPGVDAGVRHVRQPALERGGRRDRVDIIRVVRRRLVDVRVERPGRRRRESGEVRRGDVAVRAGVLGHARGPSRAVRGDGT